MQLVIYRRRRDHRLRQPWGWHRIQRGISAGTWMLLAYWYRIEIRR